MQADRLVDKKIYRQTLSAVATNTYRRNVSSTASDRIPYADEDSEAAEVSNSDKFQSEKFFPVLQHGSSVGGSSGGADKTNVSVRASACIVPTLLYRNISSAERGRVNRAPPSLLPLMNQRCRNENASANSGCISQVLSAVDMNPSSPIGAAGILSQTPSTTVFDSRKTPASARPGSSHDSSTNRCISAFVSIFRRRSSASHSAVDFHAAVRHSLSACGSESDNSNGRQQVACGRNQPSNSCRSPMLNEFHRNDTATTITSSTDGKSKKHPPPLLRGFSRLRPVTTHTPCVCQECRACVVSKFYDEPDHRAFGYSAAAEQTGEAGYEGPVAQISRFHFAWTVAGLLTYLADFVTDISVAVEFKQEGHSWWFFWTLVFIILPSVVMAIYSCIWYFEDHRHRCACDDPHVASLCCKHASKKEWCIRILFMAIGMAPLLRYLEAVRQAWRVYKTADNPVLQRNLYILYIWADADASMLRLFEAFLESAPQLVLQLYTVFKTGNRLDEISDLWDNKAFSIMFSWVSMAFTMVQFHRSLRAIRTTEKKQVRWYGSVMQFFWHLLFIGSRVLVIVAVCSSAALFGPALVFVHWIIMFCWIFSQGTTFCSERFTWQEYAYDACIAVIYIFCFFNVKDTRTLWRYVIYYCIAVPENIAGVLWYFNFTTVPHGGHRRLVVLLAVMTMMFAGIFLFQLPYYYFLHPERGVLMVDKTSKRKVSTTADSIDSATDDRYAGNINGEVRAECVDNGKSLIGGNKEKEQEVAEVQPVIALPSSSVTWNRVLSANVDEEL